MKIKWQWFVGGRDMFWVSIILLTLLFSGFLVTYVIDPTSILLMKKQSVNPESIKSISEKYVSCLGIKVNKPIIYRFVRYDDKGYEAEPGTTILLGTFHEWNGTYYIDISIDLYKTAALNSTVIHETRHMIVEYLRDEKIIDITSYTEEIAQEKTEYYNSLFNSGVFLLKEKQKEK